jgi:uncharacterized membrane protein
MNKIIVPALIMLFLDFIYLSITTNFYKNLIENIQKEKFKIKLIPTIFCYIFLVFSLYYFILKDKRKVFDAFILGLCIYAVFELTNFAIFNKWNIQAVFLDTIWGGILFTLTTYLTYKLVKNKRIIN